MPGADCLSDQPRGVQGRQPQRIFSPLQKKEEKRSWIASRRVRGKAETGGKKTQKEGKKERKKQRKKKQTKKKKKYERSKVTNRIYKSKNYGTKFKCRI